MANAVQIPQRRKALASVRKGVMQSPLRVLIYGAEKIGKSSWAAGAPAPIFIGAETGTVNLDVSRLEPQTWDEAVAWVDELSSEPHDYKTVVIDPVNWLEPLCWQKVTTAAGAPTIEDVGGGYGKGHTAALDHWRVLLHGLERCWRNGMHVILVAHSQVKNFANPEGAPYDRYELALNPKAAGALKQWVDAVLFARLETFAHKEKGALRAKGTSSGARIVHTHPCAAYDAGARWGIPEELDLSWESFWSAVQSARNRSAELIEKIVAISAAIGDEKVTELSMAFIEKNRNNADRLVELLNRLNAKLEEKSK